MQARTKTPAAPTEGTIRPDAPRAHDNLQRQAGNQAVTRAVQRLRVGAPGDASEHEADLLAPFVAARLGGIDERIGGGRHLPGAVAPNDKRYWPHPYGKALSVMVCAAGADAVAPPSRSSEILAQHAMLK